MLSLYKPVLSLLVALAAGFYVPCSDEMVSVNPQRWRCLEGFPCSHQRISPVFRWGWPRLQQHKIPKPDYLKVLSWAKYLKRSRFK